jgi:hypothetical protein
VLTAAVSLANTLAEEGGWERAAELEKAALDGFDAAGMTQHPSRVLVARNLADTRARAVGRTPSADAYPRADIDVELPGV